MFPNILILDNLSTMKTFITIVVLFFSFSLLAQSYFCTEEKVTGFNVKKNHEIIEYKNITFKINIDIENNTMFSEEIWMKDEVRCINDETSNTFYCLSTFGASLSFYPKVNKFALSQLYINTDFDDSILVSYGFCKKI